MEVGWCSTLHTQTPTQPSPPIPPTHPQIHTYTHSRSHAHTRTNAHICTRIHKAPSLSRVCCSKFFPFCFCLTSSFSLYFNCTTISQFTLWRRLPSRFFFFLLACLFYSQFHLSRVLLLLFFLLLSFNFVFRFSVSSFFPLFLYLSYFLGLLSRANAGQVAADGCPGLPSFSEAKGVSLSPSLLHPLL
jgi:hypothetical protein